MKGIADTGFIVAFLNRRDAHHVWACRLAESVETPLYTVEAVLAEAAFHVGSVAAIMSLIPAGLVQLDFDLDKNRSRVETLAKRYADRSPDLADLCLICLSEQHREHPIVTVDGDFLIYRRHQRERIPVIMP
ncbi:MAG: PIN domain-containing protein [Opitutales bacterium]